MVVLVCYSINTFIQTKIIEKLQSNIDFNDVYFIISQQIQNQKVTLQRQEREIREAQSDRDVLVEEKR